MLLRMDVVTTLLHYNYVAQQLSTRHESLQARIEAFEYSLFVILRQ